MSRQTVTVHTLGTFNDDTFLQNRIEAVLDQSCSEPLDADVVLTGDVRPFSAPYQAVQDRRLAELDDIPGTLRLTFRSNIVKYAKAYVVLDASQARQWATDFTTGSQWALVHTAHLTS